LWKELGWIEQEEFELYKKYGYYSKPLTLKDGRVFNNTKIIAINTMGCYYYNFEVLKSRYDPGDQLKWLEDELAALEKVSGSAIVIGHIPPMYDECMHGWSVRYKALAERY
jgi:hypothetical protein